MGHSAGESKTDCRKPVFPHLRSERTTIDIPDSPYTKTKIRAVERGQTLKQIVLTSFENELDMPPTTFLRAADALHLACAAGHGFTEICSSDRHLLAAAPLFGLKPRNLIV